MQKLFTLICLSIITIASHAVPMTWTESLDFDDIYFSGGKKGGIGSYTFTHDITNDGYTPGQDSAFSYSLNISLFDDQTGDKREVAFITQAGSGDRERVNISFDDIDLGGSELGSYSIDENGVLALTIDRKRGDFILTGSTITVTGIPEPTPFILFALAIVGFSIAQRKRKLG